MSNPITALSANLTSVVSFAKSVESLALESGNADVKAFGAEMSAAVTALESAAESLRAAVPGLAVVFANAGFAELSKAEPVFGLLVAAEAVEDPVIQAGATMLENMLLPAPKAPVPGVAPASAAPVNEGAALDPQP